MSSRRRAVLFGWVDVALAVGLLALSGWLLPLAQVGGGCMSQLGALLVHATVVAVVLGCGISLFVRGTAGAYLCCAIGATALLWGAVGVLESWSSDPYLAASVSAKLVRAPVVWLLPLQLAPGWLVLRARVREGAPEDVRSADSSPTGSAQPGRTS